MSASSSQSDSEKPCTAVAGPPPVEREKTIPESGGAPVSLRATVICGALAILGGFIAGYGGNQLSYTSLFRDGYVRTLPPGAEIKPPEPKKALAAYMAKGKKIYDTKCVTCHGPEAKGSGMAYPSLVGSKWALGETERLGLIILNGLRGPVSDGKEYTNVMTSQAPLTPEELAGVMTYVRNNFGNQKGDVVTVEMAKNAMKVSAARKSAGQAVTAEELKEHVKNLEGKEIKPDDMVDPLTLLPVVAAGAPAAAPAAAAAAAPAPAPVP